MSGDIDSTGVVLPLHDGRRSSAAIGRQTMRAAAEPADTNLARRIARTESWREDYLSPARDLVAATARSASIARESARAGLAELMTSCSFQVGPDTLSLTEAVAIPDDELATHSIVGGAPLEPGRWRVPFQGAELEGSDLRAQVNRWVDSEVAEPSLATVVDRLLAHPDWLDLRGHKFVVLGAGAELGPLRQLLLWGAEVWAIDIPRTDVWRRIIAQAEDTPGVLHIPVPARANVGPATSRDDVADLAGANIITQLPAVARWLSHVSGPLVLGNYGYADGALNLRLSVAWDALVTYLGQNRDVTLAFLATPTDAFEVPWDAVLASKRSWRHHYLARLAKWPLAKVKLFQPNYPRLAHRDDGTPVGIADCIVPQQGPNYLLAKRMQRWRATAHQEAGGKVSLNVAPATRTQSVVKNKLLAAAYAGAGTFGIEVFEPDTCNALMSGLLVSDLQDPQSLANPATPRTHPAELFSQSAVHGGMWRSGYDPRSVLGVAAVLGLVEQAL